MQYFLRNLLILVVPMFKTPVLVEVCSVRLSLPGFPGKPSSRSYYRQLRALGFPLRRYRRPRI